MITNIEFKKEIRGLLNIISDLKNVVSCYCDYSGESDIITIERTLQGLMNDVIFNNNTSWENWNILGSCKSEISWMLSVNGMDK